MDKLGHVEVEGFVVDFEAGYLFNCDPLLEKLVNVFNLHPLFLLYQT